MELREHAERVLFSESLEEKLAPPVGDLTDERPGTALSTPDRPGRPSELRMTDGGEKSAPTPALRLEREEDRGRLLHFFGNHELLAAELMALVLLKFPDAPPAFRQGVARTLREEQWHTRWYIERMRQCGCPFGSQPVNGFFWRAISCMASPMDFVSRLSLTFEQANLDYARHFGQLFRHSGDAATAAILDRVYQDEISHVRHGLTWFRRWKEPQLSDWEGYRRLMPFPLSPARAKGKGGFNREGRRKAGLDERFIDELEIYSQSKGRSPVVHCFNPEAEWEIGRLPAAPTPPAPMRALADDLSALTLFLAKKEDIAVLRQTPSAEFLRKLARAGFDLPETTTAEKLDLSGRKIAGFRPWAWSPGSHALFSPWFERATLPIAAWQTSWRRLHSKEFSTDLLRRMLEAEPCDPALAPVSVVGQTCRTIGQVLDALRSIQGPTAAKTPFGVAGRGTLILAEPRLAQTDIAWLERALAEEGAVIIEPWLDRGMDFSVQYEVGRGGEMHVRGYTRLHNDARGKFLACSIERPLTRGRDPEVIRFFHRHRAAIECFHRETLPAVLSPILADEGFEGPLGVDAMLFRDATGAIRCQPIVEINPRMTMGRVTLELAKLAAKGRRVIFEIVTKRRLSARGAESFVALADMLEATSPLQWETSAHGVKRLAQGALALNDPRQARACLAILRVGDHEWNPG